MGLVSTALSGGGGRGTGGSLAGQSARTRTQEASSWPRLALAVRCGAQCGAVPGAAVRRSAVRWCFIVDKCALQCQWRCSRVFARVLSYQLHASGRTSRMGHGRMGHGRRRGATHARTRSVAMHANVYAYAHRDGAIEPPSRDSDRACESGHPSL